MLYRFFYLLLIFGISACANAAPIDKRGGASITNNTDSIVLQDTNSPDTLWVLPPNNGNLRKVTKNLSAQEGQCRSLQSLTQQTQANIETRGIIQTQHNKAMTEMIAAKDAGDKNKADAAAMTLEQWRARLSSWRTRSTRTRIRPCRASPIATRIAS